MKSIMDDQGISPLCLELGKFNNTAMQDQPLYTVYNVVMLITTGWIMFSMGSGTKVEVIIEKLKRPVSNLILDVLCFVDVTAIFNAVTLPCNNDKYRGRLGISMACLSEASILRARGLSGQGWISSQAEVKNALASEMLGSHVRDAERLPFAGRVERV